MTLHNPIEYLGDENERVRQMRLQKMELGEPDAFGRRRPVAIEGAMIISGRPIPNMADTWWG